MTLKFVLTSQEGEFDTKRPCLSHIHAVSYSRAKGYQIRSTVTSLDHLDYDEVPLPMIGRTVTKYIAEGNFTRIVTADDHLIMITLTETGEWRAEHAMFADDHIFTEVLEVLDPEPYELTDQNKNNELILRRR